METLGNLMKKAAAAYPGKIAVKDERRSLTYKQVMDRALALTAYFKEIGLQKGDRFAVLMPNRLEHIELDMAAALSGAVKVPLNYRLHPREHEYMMDDAGIKAVFGDAQLLEPVKTKAEVITAGEAYEQIIETYIGQQAEADVGEDDLFAIMYTSGTTGNPKGVMLSHRNVIAGALSLALVCEMDYSDVVGHVAPLTHGSNFLSHTAWLFGLTQVVFSKFEPEEFIHELAEERVSVIFLVPTMVNLMIQHPSFDPKKLSTIKSINMGGSSIAASKLKQALSLTGPIYAQN